MSDDNPTEYKEKKWGKDDNGEYITDGYVFRGKWLFNKALEGLKTVMKKGAENEHDGIKFKALDFRQKGPELEIDVEIVEGSVRDVGVLKLYGPNKKKESVTKSKESDNKFVKILAEKLIKPLMKKYLEADSDIEHKIEGNEVPVSIIQAECLYKCTQCEKTSFSQPGLKSHITKMHNNDSIIKETVDDLLNDDSKYKMVIFCHQLYCALLSILQRKR